MTKQIENFKFSIDRHFFTLNGEEMQYSYYDEMAGEFDHYYEQFMDTQSPSDFFKALDFATKYFEQLTKDIESNQK